MGWDRIESYTDVIIVSGSNFGSVILFSSADLRLTNLSDTILHLLNFDSMTLKICLLCFPGVNTIMVHLKGREKIADNLRPSLTTFRLGCVTYKMKAQLSFKRCSYLEPRWDLPLTPDTSANVCLEETT